MIARPRGAACGTWSAARSSAWWSATARRSAQEREAGPHSPAPTNGSSTLRPHEDVRRDRLGVDRAELDLALEVADDRRGHVDLVEIVDVGDPARREDVDLEDLVPHQIDAHEVEAVGHQTRAQEVADPPLGLREVGPPARAP